MLKSGIFIFTTFLFFLFSPDVARSQQLEKNDHVIYTVESEGNSYRVTYRFRDPFGQLQTFVLNMPVEETDLMTERFGVPRWLFEPYEDTEQNRKMREDEIRKGLFLLKGNTIEVDKNAVINYYSEPFLRPIAEMIISALADYGADTRRNRIEFAIRFVQDIPYGLPETGDRARHYGGVYVPPKLLLSGFGDCDSKAILFAGILIHLIPVSDIIFLNQKEHILTAIREEPDEGMTFVRYKGDKFLVAETAGPGELRLGQKGTYYRERFQVEEPDVAQPKILDFENHPGPQAGHNKLLVPDANTIILQNESSRPFRFQISPDNRRWETMLLDAYESVRYEVRKETNVFLRIRSGGDKISTYELGTGFSYKISWNRQRKRWEISS